MIDDVKTRVFTARYFYNKFNKQKKASQANKTVSHSEKATSTTTTTSTSPTIREGINQFGLFNADSVLLTPRTSMATEVLLSLNQPNIKNTQTHSVNSNISNPKDIVLNDFNHKVNLFVSVVMKRIHADYLPHVYSDTLDRIHTLSAQCQISVVPMAFHGNTSDEFKRALDTYTKAFNNLSLSDLNSLVKVIYDNMRLLAIELVANYGTTPSFTRS